MKGIIMNKLIAIIALLSVAACQHPNQNRYGANDVGVNTTIEFGKVLKVREVEITGNNSGMGAAAGAAAGVYGGSYVGSGSGSIGGALAGALIGAFVGAAVEQSVNDRQGIEYIVKLESGKTQSIVQNKSDTDAEIRKGDRVMVQTQGEYRRVLPDDVEGK